VSEPRSPVTKSARQARVAEFIERDSIGSQTELAQRLADEGVVVTQGTLSKDLLELGAVRVRGSDGQFRYALLAREPNGGSGGPALSRLSRLCGELLLTAEGSANLTVLRTPPGAAQFFASAIDKVAWESILGTIAGDDTVVIITRDPVGGAAMAETFLGLHSS
jgi:transcriptional regulator of arginine metabolism